MSQPQTEGADFRIQRLLETANSTVEKHLSRKSSNPAEEEVTTSVVIEDGNIGYMLLTSVNNEPQAASLDAPEYGLPTEDEIAEYMHIGNPQTEVREAWQPPRELYEPIDLLGCINMPSRHRPSLKEEIKLSPANLELLMDIHRVLSVKTSRLQHAVSDLFNRATRLQDEFRDQVWRTAQVNSKVDAVTGNDDEVSDDGSTYGTAKIDDRLHNVRARQDAINTRYEKLRSKMSKISSTELSEKEANYVQEISAMDSAVDPSSTTLTDDVDGSQTPAWQRIDELRKVQKELAKQVESAKKDNKEDGGGGRKTRMNVPSHSRTKGNDEVQDMLERNAALVEAATQRLRTLGIAIPLETAS